MYNYFVELIGVATFLVGYAIGIFLEKYFTIKEYDEHWNDGWDAAKLMYNNTEHGSIIAQYTINEHYEIMVEHTDGSIARYRKV